MFNPQFANAETVLTLVQNHDKCISARLTDEGYVHAIFPDDVSLMDFPTEVFRQTHWIITNQSFSPQHYVVLKPWGDVSMGL